MARLNDPPATIESLDALKRRFIRQNREIARVNSTQSLRIRNLEAEISRLLSENISLREQAIASAHEAEKLRCSDQLRQDVRLFKDKLQMKLQEVDLLVQELGGLPNNAAQKNTRRRKSEHGGQLQSPNERDWRNRASIAGLLGGLGEIQDGRLPPILEDKYYPRRTLESAELRTVLDRATEAASESPDLGPPPVAHFEVPEVINLQPTEPRKERLQASISSEDIITLSSNLEKRRKRRTSFLLQDIPTAEPAEDKAEEEGHATFKSGAKRKLDISELEGSAAENSQNNDDFVFQRRPTLPATNAAGRRGSRFTRPPGRQIELSSDNDRQSPEKASHQKSKVLASKSTNSPMKKAAQIDSKINPPDKAEVNHHKPSAGILKGRAGAISKSRLESQKVRVNVDLTDVEGKQSEELPPKTPAGLEDLLSPVSTEPSAKHNIKEASVINSVEDVLNGSIGRASRRAKAAVSYAEPNLRDKMRRPGKELVGAVEGIDRARESHVRSGSEDRDRSKSEETNVAGVHGARFIEELESQDGIRWKTLLLNEKKEEAPSPLRDKERKDRDRVKKADQINESRQAGVDLNSAVERLSIFDPPDTPPSDPPAEADVEASLTTTSRRKVLTARRHSMQPSSITTKNPSMKPIPSRPSSAASIRNDGNKTKASLDLKRSNSVNALETQGVSSMVSSSRLDRREARRRSMMI